MKAWIDVSMWLGGALVFGAVCVAAVLAWFWLSNPPD